MPEAVFGICESVSMGRGRSIDSFLVDYIHKGQVHIYIIVKAGPVFIIPFHLIFIPFNGCIVLNHSAFEFEFSGTAIGASDDLTCPSPTNLIHQLILCHR